MEKEIELLEEILALLRDDPDLKGETRKQAIASVRRAKSILQRIKRIEEEEKEITEDSQGKEAASQKQKEQESQSLDENEESEEEEIAPVAEDKSGAENEPLVEANPVIEVESEKEDDPLAEVETETEDKPLAEAVAKKEKKRNADVKDLKESTVSSDLSNIKARIEEKKRDPFSEDSLSLFGVSGEKMFFSELRWKSVDLKLTDGRQFKFFFFPLYQNHDGGFLSFVRTIERQKERSLYSEELMQEEGKKVSYRPADRDFSFDFQLHYHKETEDPIEVKLLASDAYEVASLEEVYQAGKGHLAWKEKKEHFSVLHVFPASGETSQEGLMPFFLCIDAPEEEEERVYLRIAKKQGYWHALTDSDGNRYRLGLQRKEKEVYQMVLEKI